jgi:hypothetical protein
MIVAGIGSRKTPENVLALFRQLGQSIAECGGILRSGNANGADAAWQEGAGDASRIYLPWATYNPNNLRGKSIIVESRSDLEELVDKFHPAPQNLSPGARALIRRNIPIILGYDLQKPVDSVVCWTSGAGGTAFSLDIATANNIPVLNLAYATLDQTAIWKWIEEQSSNKQNKEPYVLV